MTFDPETRTLTLENATIDAFNNDGIEMNIMYPNSSIGVGDDITLILKGQNKITVSQDNLTERHAMQTFCTTYIKGSGSLETNYDLEIDDDCYISGGCSVKAEEILTSDYYGTGYTLSISGADTEVELISDYSGVSGYDYFVLNDGLKIVKPKDGYYDDVKKYVVNANGERALWVKISAGDEDDDWPYIVVAGHLVTRENAGNVTGDGISGSSANISWGDHGGEVKWNVRYRKAGNGTWTYWDFESGEQGWTNIDADGDGSKWYLGSSASSANTGYGYFYSSTDAGTDNWLISPKVDLGGILTVNALSALSNYKEYFTVYVSRNSFDTESVQRASQTFEVSFNNNVYQPFTIDLSDIDASGKGYIFIRHQSEKSAGFLRVDDISYMTYPESGYIEPTEWKTVNNVSTMHYALKGLEPKTKYDVQVQAIYEGEGRISEWSDILQFTTGEGAATGVAEFEADGQTAHTYDLQGRAVNGKPARVYIRNGQKVVSSK